MAAEQTKIKTENVTDSPLTLLGALMERWGATETQRVLSDLESKECARELTLAFADIFRQGSRV